MSSVFDNWMFLSDSGQKLLIDGVSLVKRCLCLVWARGSHQSAPTFRLQGKQRVYARRSEESKCVQHCSIF